MYIVVLLVVYRCSACDMSLFCLQYVIGHRMPSDRIPFAARSDSVRRPMTFAWALYGMSMVFYVQKPCLSGRL